MRNRGSFRIITEVGWRLTVLFAFHCYSTYGPNPPLVVNITVDGRHIMPVMFSLLSTYIRPLMRIIH